MAISEGKAVFRDGIILYFDYQNTSDHVFSGLRMCADDLSSPEIAQESEVKEQPRLAELTVEYGGGLSWQAWCNNERTQVLKNINADGSMGFSDVIGLGIDSLDKVHFVEHASGFGYSYSKALCGDENETTRISPEGAEGKLCLECFNRYLKN